MLSRTFFEKAIGYLWRCYAPTKAALPDAEEEDLKLIKEVRRFTMTSPERLLGLVNAIRYVVAHKIPGGIVECGVWKGGSMMAVAKTLIALQISDRDLYLFDTFAGMTSPTEKDGTVFEGKVPKERYDEACAKDGTCRWNFSPLEETRRNMMSVGYPESRIHFVKGPVELTIPEHAPKEIALLRLDTDFYSSSKHELVHLYPRLSTGGVLLLDDYGHWEGQRTAMNEYMEETGVPILLSRLDYTGRIGVKR